MDKLFFYGVICNPYAWPVVGAAALTSGTVVGAGALGMIWANSVLAAYGRLS